MDGAALGLPSCGNALVGEGMVSSGGGGMVVRAHTHEVCIHQHTLIFETNKLCFTQVELTWLLSQFEARHLLVCHDDDQCTAMTIITAVLIFGKCRGLALDATCNVRNSTGEL